MDSRELFLSTLKREYNGKVPLCIRDLTLGMDALNVPTDQVFGKEYNSKLSAECVLALQDMVKHDVTMGCIFSYGLEAIGGVTKYPADGIPYVSGHPFENPEMIDSCNPSDITGPLLKGMRESCEIVHSKRSDLALCINVPGPLTMSGFARGVETLMMDFMMNPDIAEKVVDFSVEAISIESEYMSKGIADAVYFASATDNPDMVGNVEYLKYSVDNIRKLSDQVHSEGICTIFHPHGVFSTDDRKELLDRSVATGVDGFQFAEGNDVEGILDGCKGKCSILGGVNAFSTLLMGPDKRIIRDTNAFLDQLADHHYVMTCSCSINRGLSIDNLRVMSDTLAEFNRAR